MKHFTNMEKDKSTEHYELPTAVIRENLEFLAEHLEKEQFVADNFSMLEYYKPISQTKGCGTVACAAGEGILALSEGKVLDELLDYRFRYGDRARDSNFWNNKITQYFGITTGENNDIHEATYQYLFASEWLHRDNTPEGAAKRIRYVLEHGVPMNYDEQMEGQDYLSYEI